MDVESFIWHYSRAQLQILSFIQMLIPSTIEAEDILQETSIVLFKKWNQFDKDRDFASWACGIARYEVFKYLRSQKKRSGISIELLHELSDMALQQREQENDQQRQDALANCFEQLSPSHKKLFTERYRLNKSIPNIAKLCDKTERAVYKSLSNLREVLQRCIQRQINEVAS